MELPGGLSFLAFGEPDATVKGLQDFPRDDCGRPCRHPPVFQLMVGCGMALAALSGVRWLLLLWRRECAAEPVVLRAWLLASPLGLVALEAGWMVTELGRQPWIVRGAHAHRATR